MDELYSPFLPSPLTVNWRSPHRLRLFWFKGAQVGIRSRKRPICDFKIGASTANLCNLVNLACHHGQPMKWDPSRERFTGSTGDESWLDVLHRDRWKVA